MLITVLYCTIFFAAFNFTSSIMAGLYIVQELGGSADIASYNVTLFGLGNASTFPLAHFLGARFGVRSVLLTGLALFALCTWGCALAPTFFIFVLLRLLSGICTGVFFPLGMEWIQSLFPMEQRNKSFNYLAVLTTISPVLGASFGGWLSYDFHWSLVFYTQLPLIIFCFFILYQQQGPKPTETPPLDVPGFLSYLLTIFPLTLFVCLGQELDWLRSPLLSWLLPVGLGSLLFFCAWEWRQQEPFIQLRLFTIPLFSLSCLFLILLYSAYFGMVILLTLWLHLNANYTVLWISLLLSHMLIAAWLLYLFLAKWMGKFSPWYSVFFSTAAFALSCMYSTTFNVDIDFFRLAVARVIAGFGLAFFLFPLFAICLNLLPKELHSKGIGLFQSLRLLAGAFGICGYTTLWYRRKVFYHDRLDSTLSIYNQGNLSLGKKALLEKALSEQSSSLALADVFYFMTYVMVALLILGTLVLLQSKRTRTSQALKQNTSLK